MSISNVRLLIGDPEQYDEDTLTGDGLRKTFRILNSPLTELTEVLDEGGSTVSSSAYTSNLELGTITFTSAIGTSLLYTARYKHALLSDTAISGFLSINGSEDRLAAADALMSMAASQMILYKIIKIGDLEIDSEGIAKLLKEQAIALRTIANETATFDYAEMVTNVFSERERVLKQYMRRSP